MPRKNVVTKSEPENIETNLKKSKKKMRYFDSYISKVLKLTSKENGMTNEAKMQLNSSLIILSNILAEKSRKLTMMSNKKTLSHKEVENAVNLTLNGELKTHANNEGAKSLKNYEESKNNNNNNKSKKNDQNKGLSRQSKSGILFPPSVLEKFLRNFGNSKLMVTQTAPIYLAAVLEYICVEILSVASASAHNKKRVRVTVQDIDVSIKNDFELNNLFVENNIQFIGGGVLPFIHPVLTRKKKRRKKKVTLPKEEGVKKPHRYKPGTVSIREIKKMQKKSNTLVLAKHPFEKYVREIMSEFKDDVKMSKKVFLLIQHYIEDYLVDLLKKSNLLAIHSGRVKLMPLDINFIKCILENKQPLVDCLDTNKLKDEDEEEEDDEVDEEEDDEDDEVDEEEVEEEVEED